MDNKLDNYYIMDLALCPIVILNPGTNSDTDIHILIRKLFVQCLPELFDNPTQMEKKTLLLNVSFYNFILFFNFSIIFSS